MPATLQSILETLPTLSREQLEQVKTKTAAALSFCGEENVRGRTSAPIDDWLLQGVAYVLHAHGLVRGDANSVLFRLDRNHRAAAERTQASLLEAVGRPLLEVEKVALGRVAAQAMADMISAYTTLAPKRMLDQIPNARLALENSFPGYLAAGMVGLLVKRLGVNPDGRGSLR